MVPNTMSFGDTRVGQAAGEDDGSTGRLIRAMQWRNLFAPPVVVELAPRTEVVLGRCDGLVVPQGSEGRLHLRTQDDRMSSEHAVVRLHDGRWTFRDLGSKNGSYVNGARVAEALLADGDTLEIGSTMFVFRAATPGARVTQEVIDASLGNPNRALRTGNPRLAAQLASVQRVAGAAIPMLVLGPSGTGKELMARAVHTLSGRAGDFVAINCGALPETLIESQLFGARKGAFSGAERDSPGLVRAASGGTLFLDEIAEMSERAQVTLLRVLQEKEVLPLGATTPVPVDLRVIAATHRDLRARVRDGRFREDLYARLAGMTVELPALRERREDLGMITAEILRELAGEGAAGLELGRHAARAMFTYDWPRNVRELRAALEVALLHVEGSRLPLELPQAPVAPSAPGPRPAAGEKRDAIVAALQAERGNVSAAARRLGYSRAHLNRLLRQHGIDPAVHRGA
jgi:DNA-binding NtrC family response regulator